MKQLIMFFQTPDGGAETLDPGFTNQRSPAEQGSGSFEGPH